MRKKKNNIYIFRSVLLLAGIFLFGFILPLTGLAATDTLDTLPDLTSTPVISPNASPEVTTSDPFMATTSPDKPVGEVILDSLDVIGDYLGFSDVGLQTIVARLIRLFLSFIGIILVLIIIYAGLMWMTSGGDDEKVAKAKKTIINAIIGLIIILLSNTIVRFIVGAVGVGDGG